ncbi:MAG: hypothetical protein QG673_1504 [Pseudomonadota bacterium]|nr:hypothetical protein [Pseudomonadota bacterium]
MEPVQKKRKLDELQLHARTNNNVNTSPQEQLRYFDVSININQQLTEQQPYQANRTKQDNLTTTTGLYHPRLTRNALQKLCQKGAKLDRRTLMLAIETKLNVSKVDLSKVDLSGLDLTNVDFSNTNLAYANLERTNLRGTILPNMAEKLHMVQLNGAKLDRDNLIKVAKAKVNSMKIASPSDKADLNLEGLEEINLSDQDLSNLDLSNLGLTEDKYFMLTRANFCRANLTGAKFSNILLNGVNFDNANFSQAEFSQVHMIFCALDCTNFSSAQLRKVSLRDTSLIDIITNIHTRIDLDFDFYFKNNGNVENNYHTFAIGNIFSIINDNYTNNNENIRYYLISTFVNYLENIIGTLPISHNNSIMIINKIFGNSCPYYSDYHRVLNELAKNSQNKLINLILNIFFEMGDGLVYYTESHINLLYFILTIMDKSTTKEKDSWINNHNNLFIYLICHVIKNNSPSDMQAMAKDLYQYYINNHIPASVILKLNTLLDDEKYNTTDNYFIFKHINKEDQPDKYIAVSMSHIRKYIYYYEEVENQKHVISWQTMIYLNPNGESYTPEYLEQYLQSFPLLLRSFIRDKHEEGVNLILRLLLLSDKVNQDNTVSEHYYYEMFQKAAYAKVPAPINLSESDRYALTNFFKKAYVDDLTTEKLPIDLPDFNLKLSDEHINNILEIYDMTNADADSKGGIFILLSYMFAELGSERFLGTSNNQNSSPNALKSYAYHLLKTACKYRPTLPDIIASFTYTEVSTHPQIEKSKICEELFWGITSPSLNLREISDVLNKVCRYKITIVNRFLYSEFLPQVFLR